MKQALHSVLRMVLLSALYMAACATSGCTSPRKELNVYIWHSYIDMDMLPAFEREYKQQTGIAVKVRVRHFDSNEELLARLNAGRRCDLACPSDYIIQDLIDHQLLQQLDHERIAPVDSYSPWLLGFDYDRGNEYSVPYLYGTTGILYNAAQPDVTRDGAGTWQALWNPQFRHRIFLKHNIYDLYAITALYVRRDELLKRSDSLRYPLGYKEYLRSVLDDRSEALVNDISTALAAQKPLVKAYLNSSEKMQMEMNRGSLYLAWSSEAAYCMDRNRALEFVVPREGSYAYIHSWVMPAKAQNTDEAYAFLNFIYRKENAKRIMIAAGAPTAVSAALEEYRSEMMADSLRLFKNMTAEWVQQYMDARFPSAETLKRCWTLSSLGDDAPIIRRAMMKLWDVRPSPQKREPAYEEVDDDGKWWRK